MEENRSGFFPKKRGYVELVEIDREKLKKNSRGNLQVRHPNVKRGQIEIVDSKNPTGFTALRYEEAFHDLSSALGLSFEGPSREVLYRGGEAAVSRDAWSIMSKPTRARIAKILPRINELNIPGRGRSTDFLVRVRLLEVLTGVKVDLYTDLRLRRWGGRPHTPKILHLPSLVVADPDRILEGFTTDFVLPDSSELPSLQSALRESLYWVESRLSANHNLTEAEMSELRSRMEAILSSSPSR